MILAVVGARPNFVKMAPVVRALGDRAAVLHTGQHYDHALSGSFLEQLGMPDPTFHLGVGSGSHAAQTAAVLVGVEEVLTQNDVELLLVAGDVNSTMAAALAAVKLHIPVAHLEAGLRSGDWTMPEEVNRVVTDRVSDLLLCPSDDAPQNLAQEGIEGDHVVVVGNTMIDSLLRLLPVAQERGALERLGLEPQRYVLATLHRPALVDDPAKLLPTLDALAGAAGELPVVLPLHPRTRGRLEAAGYDAPSGLRLLEPLEYLDFIALEAGAAAVVTDSGGLQEETSALGVPCLTYRTTTERPVTCSLGTNKLIGVDPQVLRDELAAVLASPPPAREPIPLWDGRAGERCADVLERFAEARAALA
jgi:UDP-N-acetylglucosamine 2-epimerase (non-hydrolysing)